MLGDTDDTMPMLGDADAVMLLCNVMFDHRVQLEASSTLSL